MDEERLGIAVEADASSLFDLESDITAHLDRVDEQISGRTIEGPQVVVPEPDLANVEKAAAGMQGTFDRNTPQIDGDTSPLQQKIEEATARLTALAEHPAKVAVDGDTTELAARLTQARQLVDDFAQNAQERGGNLSARLDVKQFIADLRETEAAFKGDAQASEVFAAAITRLQELKDRDTGALPSIFGDLPDTVGELEVLGQGLEKERVTVVATSRDFEGLRRNIEDTLGDAGGNAENAATGIRHLLEAISSGGADATENAQRLHAALQEIRQEAAEPQGGVVTPEVDPNPALRNIDEVVNALQDMGRTRDVEPIHLPVDQASFERVNELLTEAKTNIHAQVGALHELRTLMEPDFEAIGVSAEDAAPRINTLWDALLKGKLVLDPVNEAAATIGHIKELLAQNPVTNVIDTSQDVQDIQTLEDKWNELRASGITSNAFTGEAGIPQAPIVPPPPPGGPPDGPNHPNERDFQILATGLADVSREQEEAAASAASLREVMTSSGQAAARAGHEDQIASDKIKHLGEMMRKAGQDSHAHGDGLTFEGLALRKLSSELGEVATTALGVEGPMARIVETLLEISVGHEAVIAVAAGLGALALAWNLVHEAAQRAKEEQNEALQGFLKATEAAVTQENQGTIVQQSRDVLENDRAELQALNDIAVRNHDIIGALVTWASLQKTINLLTRTNADLEEDALRRRNQRNEAERIGVINLRAQTSTELVARVQATTTIAEAELQAARQASQQRLALRTAEIGNQLVAAREAAAGQAEIDRQFFDARERLAQQSALAQKANIDEQIRDEREKEARSGPGIPKETQEQKDARTARIEGLKEQAVLIRIQLGGQLAQIDAERQLARLTRERTVQQAELAQQAAEHAARVERARQGGNVTADFGGVGIVPTLPPDALALTQEQVRLLAANIKPLEIPVILAPASIRENLDVVGQELQGRQEDAQRFAAELNAVAEAGSHLSGVAENLNIISEEMSTVLNSTFQLIGGLSQVQLAAVHFQQATDRAGRFAAELERIGGIVSIIGSAVGIVAGIGHALFGGENEHDRLLQANTDALERNTAQKEVQERFAGIGGLVDFEHDLEAGLTNFRQAFAEREQQILAITQRGVPREVAELQVDPLRSLETQLQDAGLSLEDLQAIAEQVAPGLELVDSSGHLVAGALDQLNQAVEDSIVAQFRWQDTFEDQRRKLTLESRLAGVEQNPEQQFREEINAAIASGSTAIREALGNIDLGDPDAVRAALQRLERAFTTHALDFEDIGHLTRDQWLQFLEDGASFLDTFNDSIADVNKQLNDVSIPEGFRREAIAFEVGNRGTPFPPSPPVLSFPGGPVVEPRHTDTGVTIPKNTDALNQQTDATSDQTDATSDQTDATKKQTEVQERAIASTDTLVTSIDRQHDVTLDLIAVLQRVVAGSSAATPPSLSVAAQTRPTLPTAPTVNGGLHVHVHVNAAAGVVDPRAVAYASEAGVRQALHNIGLVQSGDSLQINVD
jgi:hypothetical protein